MSSLARPEQEHAGTQPPVQPPTGDGDAARVVAPLLHSLFGPRLPVRIEFWDGSSIGPDTDGPLLRVTSPNALRRMLWAPDQLGIARAYVAGELGFEGDIFGLLATLRDATPPGLRVGPRFAREIATAARRLGALGPPPPPPAEEARARGWRHSIQRDARAISHHYDVSNDFYRIVLGPAMTYSCARFTSEDVGLEQAQAAKHELICRKLGLHRRRGMRLLDVGCGWGTLALHAATHHEAQVVGVTISRQQVDFARRRVAKAGLSDRIDIRLQDYRQVRHETFDAIASVGMFEHVGKARLVQYFDTLYGLLVPRGRLLNHAITSVDGSRLARRSFAARYVFPDGELIDVGEQQLAMERSGFEIRDVESLREHYAQTLRCWARNLEADWDRAVALVGTGRARVWRLYMAASALGFEDGGNSVHQVLGVKSDVDGDSGMPRTRRDWD